MIIMFPNLGGKSCCSLVKNVGDISRDSCFSFLNFRLHSPPNPDSPHHSPGSVTLATNPPGPSERQMRVFSTFTSQCMSPSLCMKERPSVASASKLATRSTTPRRTIQDQERTAQIKKNKISSGNLGANRRSSGERPRPGEPHRAAFLFNNISIESIHNHCNDQRHRMCTRAVGYAHPSC